MAAVCGDAEGAAEVIPVSSPVGFGDVTGPTSFEGAERTLVAAGAEALFPAGAPGSFLTAGTGAISGGAFETEADRFGGAVLSEAGGEALGVGAGNSALC